MHHFMWCLELYELADLNGCNIHAGRGFGLPVNGVAGIISFYCMGWFEARRVGISESDLEA